MATTRLAPDFKEFLRLLRSAKIEYLLIGGYAVGHYGFPRATGDLDIWVANHNENATRLVRALREFGFDVPELNESLFQKPQHVVRMGVPPVRLEILSSIDGVDFQDCYPRRETVEMDGVEVDVISLADLKMNKRASGRHQDLNDLEKLP
ncbi:MAG TPA: nucleotidyltransferase [Chthoniobacterales bacterium]|nr:nucleotidyltransferase [Chthoniobacterales bacterium]